MITLRMAAPVAVRHVVDDEARSERADNVGRGRGLQLRVLLNKSGEAARGVSDVLAMLLDVGQLLMKLANFNRQPATIVGGRWFVVPVSSTSTTFH